MLTFYYLDSANKAANDDMFALHGQALADRRKSISREYRFSAAFSKKIFQEDQQISHVFLAHIINNKVFPGLPESSNLLYFYLDPFWLKLIVQELDALGHTGSDDREMKEFAGLMKDCLDRKGSCMVEYSKKDGWFDYDEIMRRKRAEIERARKQIFKQ